MFSQDRQIQDEIFKSSKLHTIAHNIGRHDFNNNNTKTSTALALVRRNSNNINNNICNDNNNTNNINNNNDKNNNINKKIPLEVKFRIYHALSTVYGKALTNTNDNNSIKTDNNNNNNTNKNTNIKNNNVIDGIISKLEMLSNENMDDFVHMSQQLLTYGNTFSNQDQLRRKYMHFIQSCAHLKSNSKISNNNTKLNGNGNGLEVEDELSISNSNLLLEQLLHDAFSNKSDVSAQAIKKVIFLFFCNPVIPN